jgi:hypothetical protein
MNVVQILPVLGHKLTRHDGEPSECRVSSAASKFLSAEVLPFYYAFQLTRVATARYPSPVNHVHNWSALDLAQYLGLGVRISVSFSRAFSRWRLSCFPLFRNTCSSRWARDPVDTPPKLCPSCDTQFTCQLPTSNSSATPSRKAFFPHFLAMPEFSS